MTDNGNSAAKPRLLVRATWLLACLLLGAVTITPALCRRGADAIWNDELEDELALAGGVERWVAEPLVRESFTTGSALFDGEWLFGTYMMAGLGFAQLALAHPELRERHAPLVATCIDRMISPELRAFDAARHGEDPLDSLAGGRRHAAYLGYLGIVLGMHRMLEPNGRHAALHDRVAAALAERLDASAIGLIETYPGETYPVDNLAVAATLALHQRTTGVDHSRRLERFVANLRERYVDGETGLLIQAVDLDGRATDAPRGSGTALGVYFAAMVDAELSRDLYAALTRELAHRYVGFGVVDEYPDGFDGRGDIDSGPIILGAGLSATGFSLAGARLWDDRDHFRATWATASLWGAPLRREHGREWVSGGPLGNALLFAMLTAPRGGFDSEATR